MPGLDEEQRFLFDNFGYITVPGAVAPTQVGELRDTLRFPTEQFAPVTQDEGPLHWGPAWRELLDLPRISAILEDLIGNHDFLAAREAQHAERPDRPPLPTFRLDHINVHTHVKQGFKGMNLHGGWQSTGGSQYFRYHDGRFYNGLVVVAVELHDTWANDGGFCCIPGSHKANLPVPASWRKLDERVPPAVRRIPASAGDAIIFTEALVHGTLPWHTAAPRQTVFYKFSPHGTSWSADFFDPDDFRCYDDMDDRRLAMLEPPNARYRGRPTQPPRKAAPGPGDR